MSTNCEDVVWPPKAPMVEAIYRPSPLLDYRGNPFIEALPEEPSDEHFARVLPSRPPYDESERRLPRHLRAHCILRLLRYFEPLGKHYDLALRMDMMMRSGYVSRNPNKPAFRERLQAIYELSQQSELEGAPWEDEFPSWSMALVGVSGSGKTRAIKRILTQYPQCISHKQYNLTQIPWIFVESPNDGSVKELCTGFFRAVDRVLGGNDFVKRFGGDRVTGPRRIFEVAQTARLFGIGLIVLDELQHIRAAGTTGSEKLLNALVTLVNASESPILMVGTSSARHLLQSDFRQAKRASGLGGLDWDRSEMDDELRFLFKEIWRYQWTAEESPYTEEIERVLYDKTQGVIDLVVKLYVLAQYRAIAIGFEKVTPELICSVADDEFKLLQPMLDALASGDPVRIAKFDDLSPLNFDKIIQREQSLMASRMSVQALRDKVSAEACEGDTAASSPASAAKEKRPRNVQVKPDELPPDDLRKRVFASGTEKSGYELLKECGVVSGPMDALHA